MKVSVCTLTYNHAPYIEQCINSALIQKVNFDFDIWVGDDGSDDGTSEIIAKMAVHDNRIKHIIQDRKNVIYINGRKTGRYNFISIMESMTAEYIAMLDGDDYWTDAEKLKTMTEFLDRNRRFSFAFHACNVSKKGVVQNDYFNENTPSVVDRKYMARYGNCIRTLSVVFRNNFKGHVPTYLYTTPIGDYPFHLYNLGFGQGKFINKNMGVYRKHDGGIWNSYRALEMKIEWVEMLENMRTEFEKELIPYWNIQLAEITYSIGKHFEMNNEPGHAQDYLTRSRDYSEKTFHRLQRGAKSTFLNRFAKMLKRK